MRLQNPTKHKLYKSVQDFLLDQSDKSDQSIVFTNGCFDILHVGHVDYLEKASKKANFLIVGLNSDDSVTRLKGANRPINSWENRAKVLAALGFVDAVIFFSEDTPLELIQQLTPQVLVKGSDYRVENIVGASHVLDHGGRVETIDFVHHISTTSIIENKQDD